MKTAGKTHQLQRELDNANHQCYADQDARRRRRHVDILDYGARNLLNAPKLTRHGFSARYAAGHHQTS
jgi:hypothetical protein